MPTVPLNVEIDETVYLALRLRAAQEKIASSEVVNCVLRSALQAEVKAAACVPRLDVVLRYVDDSEESRLMEKT